MRNRAPARIRALDGGGFEIQLRWQKTLVVVPAGGCVDIYVDESDGSIEVAAV